MADAPALTVSRTAATAQTRKLRTRAALRAAMLELLLEMPFDQIQITDLTARAGIGYATFFRHYAGTQGLFEEIAGDQIAALLDMTIPDMRQFDSATSTLALCRYVDDNRALWRVLLTGGAAQTVRAEFVRQAREWARRFDDGRTTSVPLDLGTVCSAGSTIDALAWWLERADAFRADEIAAFINRLIIAPFVGE